MWAQDVWAPIWQEGVWCIYQYQWIESTPAGGLWTEAADAVDIWTPHPATPSLWNDP